jgi:hypothetical protein
MKALTGVDWLLPFNADKPPGSLKIPPKNQVPGSEPDEGSLGNPWSGPAGKPMLTSFARAAPRLGYCPPALIHPQEFAFAAGS